MTMDSVLTLPTLVLNRAWVPIRTTSVREALCLLFKGAAHAVEPETYRLHDFDSWASVRALEGVPLVRGVSISFPVPEILVLNRFDRVPEGVVVFSRRNLFKRDKYTCQYCGAQPGTEELTIDHVLPRSRGGQSTWENCVLACVSCNARKASRTPAEAGLRLRSKPARPAWKPVFTLRLGTIPTSWKDFLDEAYWNVELKP
jgi:5-methylcytosine-specific restriction endonuclease McrA